MARIQLTDFRPATLVFALAAGCEASGPVDAARLAAIRVTPDSADVVQGDTLRLLGAPVDDDGVAFLGPTLAWRSSDPAVASVDAEGEVVALGPGTTTVEAFVGDVSGQAQIVVLTRGTVALDTNAVGFMAAAGGADPADQTVGITNAGAGPLTDISVGAITYGTGQPTGWLTVAIDAGAPALILRVTVAGLAAGTYNAVVPVGVGGRPPDATLTVTLVVT